jgi:hypothetical protein
MYKVGINGVEKEVEAHGMSVESGTIIFFEDENHLTSKLVVASGKWDYLEVVGDSQSMQVRPQEPKPIKPEHPAVVEVREEEAEQLKNDAAEGV